MDKLPVSLVKCTDKGSKAFKILGKEINIKLVLIVVGLLVLFFVIVLPFIKSRAKKEHGFFEDLGDTVRMVQPAPKKERFSIGHNKEHANLFPGLAKLYEKFSPLKETLVPNFTKIADTVLGGEHFSPAEEIFKNLSSMPAEDLRKYIAGLDATQKKTIMDAIGAENVGKLNDIMGGKILEGMSDYVKPNESTATGSLSPAPANDIDNFKIENQMCSKSCCSPQWGVKPEPDDRIQPNDLGTKFMPTNYMCSGDNVGDKGNGCVCIDKDTFSYLGNRGGNNIE